MRLMYPEGGCKMEAQHFRIKGVFLKYILCSEIFIFCPTSAKQFCMHKYSHNSECIVYVF